MQRENRAVVILLASFENFPFGTPSAQAMGFSPSCSANVGKRMEICNRRAFKSRLLLTS